MQKRKDKKFNCHAAPLFTSIPLTNIIPDTLHLFIRIADQLVGQIISYLQTLDCLEKFTKEKIEKCTNIMKFQQFIHSLNFRDWNFGVKDGKLHYRTFTGPEHRKILEKIDFDLLIPNHEKLDQIHQVWSSYRTLSKLWDKNLTKTEIDEFQKEAKDWVNAFARCYLMRDITPYIHVLAFHLPEAMRMHGNISHFCQQGLEIE